MASSPAPILAADLGTPPPAVEQGDAEAIRTELTRYGILYALRAAFNVVELEDISSLLRADLARLEEGESTEEKAALDRDLTAEGSYYIVSLRYLVAYGGANWPADKPADDYARDAAVLLDGLQTRWLDAIAGGEDMLGIAREVDRINAWTEGYAEVPADLDHFGGLAAMVDELLVPGAEKVGV
ncbi:MAG: hypothetical protein ABL879_02765 [Devosia sp.]